MKREQATYFPPIALAADAARPLYRQIYDWFRQAILDGRLHPGQGVPSTRTLAAGLRISRAPVLNAFEQLHAEGYLETRTGAGTRVASALAVTLSRPPQGTPRAERAKRPKAPARVAARAAAWSWAPSPWLRHAHAFRVGVPAIDEFPIGVWSSDLARHARRPLAGVADFIVAGKNASSMGHESLRTLIAEYLGTMRSVQCTPDQIMIVQGTQHGLQIASRALLEEGDAVWMEEPGYWGARGVFESAGARLVPIPVDANGLIVSEGIRRKPDARAVYVTPSHQFPLGSTMGLDRRLQLLDWAVRRGAWIFEDDYDSEYRFSGAPLASLQGLDPNARVIYFGTFSKVLLPGLRMGYAVVPEALVEAFQVIRRAIDIYSPALFQVALADFIRDGHFARHIRRMKGLYMKRRDVLVELLRERLRAPAIVGAETGMHLALRLPPASDDVALSRILADDGISAAPLSTCCIERPGESGLILGYGNVEAERIPDAVDRLVAVMRQHPGAMEMVKDAHLR